MMTHDDGGSDSCTAPDERLRGDYASSLSSIGVGDLHVRRRHLPRDEPNDEPLPASRLTVGRADDPAEDRADRFAETVVAAMSSSLPRTAPEASTTVGTGERVHRSPMAPSAAERSPVAGPSRVRRAATSRDPLGGSAVDRGTASRIQRASGGVALPDTLRRSAEHASGRDLRGVRVHSGSSATDLNERVQATAFTVGNKIFLGGAAARPGTAAGDRLLAHEVGHVVEEGGGNTVGRVRRRTDLRPLESTGAPTVRRLFGSKKKKRKKEEERQAALTASIRANAEREAENHPQFAPLKSAVERVERLAATLQADQTQLASLGPRLVAVARQIDRAFEGAERDPGFGPLKRRARIAGDDVQILLDHLSVANTKRQAGDIYMNEGRQGNFKALSDHMRNDEFADQTGRAPHEQSDNITARGLAGAALGLTKAEQTAITVFTAKDYSYINPATANSRSWMLANRDDARDKAGVKPANLKVASQMDDAFVANRNEEGSLHAGMAVQGLNKLPLHPQSVPTYRGETFKEADFKKKFKVDKKGALTPLTPTVTRSTISSTTKNRALAEAFVLESSGKLGLGDARKEAFCLVWEFTLTNGRDIEALSANGHEEEVATLPGAKFKIESISPYKYNNFQHIWLVKATQIA